MQAGIQVNEHAVRLIIPEVVSNSLLLTMNAIWQHIAAPYASVQHAHQQCHSLQTFSKGSHPTQSPFLLTLTQYFHI